MTEAIITGVVAIIVCMINNTWQSKRADRQHQATMDAAEKQHNTTIALIEYKLDQLTHKVEMHNNAVFRLTSLETEVKNMKERLTD